MVVRKANKLRRTLIGFTVDSASVSYKLKSYNVYAADISSPKMHEEIYEVLKKK
jgi:hypothetical protein